MSSVWYKKRWFVILLHVVCWLLVFTLPFLLRPSFDEGPKHKVEEKIPQIITIIIVSRLIWIGLFYLNANLLVPEIIYKKRFRMYVGILIVTFTALFLMDRLMFYLFMPDITYKAINFFAFNFFPVLFILTASTVYRMINDRTKAEKLQKETQYENLKTELSLLRSQVSPHFMFNILNNMVALGRKNSSLLEPSLIKLSLLLRYMLYETQEKVSLHKEIEYLQSYIDLQQQRFGAKLLVSFSKDDVDGDYEIEPMLLIPFVENAFKHGTGMIENAQIMIDLKVEKGLLSFQVRNRFNENSAEIKDNTSGIGLANVQRRLKLLYDSNHSLLITKKQDWFIVSLQIQLM
jgi:two-component system LytT family sensor kinase